MPAPIVPVNSRQEATRPREVGTSIRDLNYFPPTSQRLNIYGIDPKASMASRETAILGLFFYEIF